MLDQPESFEKLPKHELFLGADSGMIDDWRPYTPPFRTQGSSYYCTAFAGTAIGTMFNKLETGKEQIFSALELFYRTGGSTWGNSLISTAIGMDESLVREQDKPTPVLTAWNEKIWAEWKPKAKATTEAFNIGRNFRMKNPASVKTDNESLRRALRTSPLMLAVGIGAGYFDKVAPRVSTYSAYHAVVLVKMNPDGSKIIFDSLTQTRIFDGFHVLAPDYEVLSALSFVDLPNEWKEIQDGQSNDTMKSALDHYGKARSLATEQAAAATLSAAVKKNPTVAALMGREWTIAVNAVAYGKYSVQDLLNHYTNMRRTGKGIFDLNKMRV